MIYLQGGPKKRPILFLAWSFCFLIFSQKNFHKIVVEYQEILPYQFQVYSTTRSLKAISTYSVILVCGYVRFSKFYLINQNTLYETAKYYQIRVQQVRVSPK